MPINLHSTSTAIECNAELNSWFQPKLRAQSIYAQRETIVACLVRFPDLFRVWAQELV